METHLKFRKGYQNKFIEEALIKNGSRINDLARLSGVSSRNFRDWKREKTCMSKSAVLIISKKYNVVILEKIEVMEKSFKYGGASELSFVNVLGHEGEYQEHALAYGRKGEKCSICGGKIEKIFLGGRGTFFCPKHQK